MDRVMRRIAVPWEEDSTNPYQSCGPASGSVEFEAEGVRFRVTEVLGEFGIHTGRKRYRAECLECGCEVHPATTGPRNWIEGHLAQQHGWVQFVEAEGRGALSR